MYRKVIHVFFFYVFSVISAGPRFVEIQKFCYHGNVEWRLLFSIMRLAGARSETKRFSELLISYNTAYYSASDSDIPRVFRMTKSFFGFGLAPTDCPQMEKPPVIQLQTRIWFSSRYPPRSSVRSVKRYFNSLLQRTISVKCNQEYMTSKGKPTWTEFPFTYRLLILICTRKDEVSTSSLSIRIILDSFFVLNCQLESYVCRRSYFRYGLDTCLHCDEKWHKHISNVTISFQDQVDRGRLHPV